MLLRLLGTLVPLVTSSADASAVPAQTPAAQTPVAATPENEGPAPERPTRYFNEDRYAPNPMYPLWEGASHVQGPGEVYAGTSFLQVGVLPRLAVGIRPLSYFFRAPNVHLRVFLLERGPLRLAAQAEAMLLMRGASEAFTSSNFVSRLDNSRSELPVLPLSVTATYAVAPTLVLHATSTVLTVFGSGPFRTTVSPGLLLAAELAAPKHHSLMLHAGEIGFWNHDFLLIGASYRYQRGIFEARVGYFFRFLPEGRQGAPLLSLGFQL